MFAFLFAPAIPTTEEKVRRGAKFLDRVTPGWEKRVKIRSLDIGCQHNCVLAQIHGSYTDGFNHYGLNTRGAVNLGFNVVSKIGVARTSYTNLTELWKEEIRKRLHATQVIAA